MTKEEATSFLLLVAKDYNRRPPKLMWRQSTVHGLTSGRFKRRLRKIVITAGVSGEDHKQVLLHEIAHWMTMPKLKRVYFYGEWKRRKRGGHNKRFWLKLRELLVKYNCLTDDYIAREGVYKSRSLSYLTKV